MGDAIHGKKSTKSRFFGVLRVKRNKLLVDYFKHEGRIMIATEAGAEDINLQFCSLVVNYDLPLEPPAY
jgi:adenine-specific DNA-methyltransferase